MTQNLPPTPPTQADEAAEMRRLCRRLYRLAVKADTQGRPDVAAEARQVARDARRLARETKGDSHAQ